MTQFCGQTDLPMTDARGSDWGSCAAATTDQKERQDPFRLDDLGVCVVIVTIVALLLSCLACTDDEQSTRRGSVG